MNSKDAVNVWTGRDAQQENSRRLACVGIGVMLLIVTPIAFLGFTSVMELGEPAAASRYIACGMLLTFIGVVYGMFLNLSRPIAFWPAIVLLPTFLAFVGCIETAHPMLSVGIMLAFSFGGFVVASTINRVLFPPHKE